MPQTMNPCALLSLILTPFVLNATVKDTLPLTVHYYTETARPANGIKKTFPYDIDLQDTAGKVINSNLLFKNKKSKPTILLFWLTTCYPCRMELEAIQQAYPTWKKEVDFRMIAISTDFKDRFPQFTERVRQSNWSFEAYHDKNREFRYVMPGELNGLPQLFVLDAAGNITYHKRRYRPGDENELFEHLKKMK
jgi:cytochrome c biogenesis protein CcmG, thiol:disulfide interchange protein DsbE